MVCVVLFPSPRRYRGMIIDAGSTGSRIWIFAWSPGPCQHDALPSMVTPTVVASYQVKGGLSSASAKLNDTLTELLNFAEDILKDRKEDMHLPNMV